ncbi:MAG: SpoIIE family protein phosphatase [Verrucomicrobiia bacterium]
MSQASSESGADSGASRRLDLSRVRHELRTPINHILGYTEMLLEEGQLPASFMDDLRRIHVGGRQLQNLISEYFDEDKFFNQRNLHQLYHELRTPVNHIIGYCELLQEQAEEQGILSPIADLNKIRAAAAEWLALVEAYLIETPVAGPDLSGEPDEGQHRMSLVAGLGIQVPTPKSTQPDFLDQGAILIVDDDEQNRDMLARRLRRCGYAVSVAASGVQALQMVRRQKFDLVLLDMIMPGLDGFQILARIKSDAVLKDMPVVMLSALDEENGIARCIEMGAEDYLAKPFNAVFLRARIGACLEKKRLRDRERATHQALQRSQKHLSDELTKAAGYVRSLLPAPLSGNVETEWCFHPTEQLGGDAFGYHWIDDNHFAVYLLDVSGHGVGAALLSVSVLNALRAHTLPGVDFRHPQEVLPALNRVFWMENQSYLYFTLWYGVYSPVTRQLDFASGGHPPALLVSSATGAAVKPLVTTGPAVGCFEGAVFPAASESVPPCSRLLLFSDGIFEIFKPGEAVGTLDEFVKDLEQPEILALHPEERWKRAQQLRGAPSLEDDFSLVEVRFD